MYKFRPIIIVIVKGREQTSNHNHPFLSVSYSTRSMYEDLVAGSIAGNHHQSFVISNWLSSKRK